MNSIEFWTAFFGWCTVVNIGIYLITVIALWLMRGFAYRMNARIFALDEADVARTTTANPRPDSHRNVGPVAS